MGKRRPYTSIEDNHIIANHCSTLDRIIAVDLGRTVKAIRHRAKKLGLKPKKLMHHWTPEEDKTILAATGRKLQDVATELRRNIREVIRRSRKLGIKSWTRKDGPLMYRGYEVAYCKGNNSGEVTRKMLHVAVLEEHLGRNIERGEIPHHINENKRDNRIENLYLCRDASEHCLLHHSLKKLLSRNNRDCIVFNRDKGVYELCEPSKQRSVYRTGMDSTLEQLSQ